MDIQAGSTVDVNFLTSNVAVNLAQVAGATVLTGVGTSTGAQRVTLATAGDTGASVSVAAGTTTLIVTGVASSKIYVTGYALSMATTGTFQFISGTGINCGTGATNLTPAINLIAGNAFTFGSGVATVLETTANADNLCVAAVTGNVVGHLRYAIRP